jgi:hypothetical protein
MRRGTKDDRFERKHLSNMKYVFPSGGTGAPADRFARLRFDQKNLSKNAMMSSPAGGTGAPAGVVGRARQGMWPCGSGLLQSSLRRDVMSLWS